MANNFAEIHSNWQYVIPPSRPSIYEIERIRLILQTVDREKPIAVLGSTIEFRNLLHNMNFRNIFVFERNRSFYEWTNSWITHDIECENVIWGNWLDTIRHYKNYFAVVLSDLTMGNISYGERGQFYDDIYNSIQNRGLFIDKVLTHCIPHTPLDELMRKYENLPINLENINRFSCEILFCSTLLDEEVIDTTRFYDILRRRYTTPVLAKFIDKAHLITPENCVWYYGKMWNELEAQYINRYSHLTMYEDYPCSPYYGRCKQFIHIK